MLIKYKLRADIKYDEDAISHTVYGVTALDQNGKLIKTVPDVFFDKNAAENFVALCNAKQLAPEHLHDVCEDQLI